MKSNVVDYFEYLEERLDHIQKNIDLSADPYPVQENEKIVEFLQNEWPEVIDKINEYTNKKALAEMLVPTGVVAAFGLCGAMIGALFGGTPIVGFSAGTFIGMYATRQVTTKDVSRRIDDSLEEKKNETE